jgi:hypothetical protein
MSKRAAPQIDASAIGPDTPLRLDVAVRIVFPCGSGITVASLRREAARGNLDLERIAGKQFVTLRAIEEMRKRCRDLPKEPVSGSNPKNEMPRESSYGAHRGSSETERIKSALDALKQTARGLSKPSANTSPGNTKCRETADVILLKS